MPLHIFFIIISTLLPSKLLTSQIQTLDTAIKTQGMRTLAEVETDTLFIRDMATSVTSNQLNLFFFMMPTLFCCLVIMACRWC